MVGTSAARLKRNGVDSGRARLRAEKESNQIISKAEKGLERTAEVERLLAHRKEEAEAALAKRSERQATAQQLWISSWPRRKRPLLKSSRKFARSVKRVFNRLKNLLKARGGRSFCLKKPARWLKRHVRKWTISWPAEKEGKQSAKMRKRRFRRRQQKESQQELSEEKKKFEAQKKLQRRHWEKASLHEEMKKKLNLRAARF